MYRLTRSAFLAIGSADCSRADFRLDAEGHPNLVEINTLPGLNPEVSDMCIIARAQGMHYAVLINEILNLAIERHGMLV
jgi:D-alanine-D-alanine ligase